jgi:hypothetical protein
MSDFMIPRNLMQTFLPFANLKRSVQCLDDKRLANQVNEALVILRTLTGYYGPGGGWANHPAVKMWRGYEPYLDMYRTFCMIECNRRGINRNFAEAPDVGRIVVAPPWMGGAIHQSHQAALYRKDPIHYAQFADVEYIPYV